MWIMMADSFLSIVDPKGAYDGSSGPISKTLLVRARIAGDIEAVFPNAKVSKTPGRDYLFRAMIDREEVAAAILNRVRNISASNFKGSVRDKQRHDAYLKVWAAMEAEQRRRYRPQRSAVPARDMFEDDQYEDHEPNREPHTVTGRDGYRRRDRRKAWWEGPVD